jgi:hypothetical protein
MTLLDLSSGVTGVFIIGMIWLRTRMQYLGLIRRAPGHKLQLVRSGRVYFACAAVLLIIGWFAAPLLGAAFWPATAANAGGIAGISGGIGGNGTAAHGTVTNPALTRVIWFLLTYYVFIFVHRAIQARGIAVFKISEAGTP